MSETRTRTAVVARALLTWQDETEEIEGLHADAHLMPGWVAEDAVTALFGQDWVRAQVEPRLPEGGVIVTSDHLDAALFAIAAGLAQYGRFSAQIQRSKERTFAQRPRWDGSPATVLLLDPEGYQLAEASSDDTREGVRLALIEAVEVQAQIEKRIRTLLQRGHDLDISNRAMARATGKTHPTVANEHAGERTPELVAADARIALARAGLLRQIPHQVAPLPQGPRLSVVCRPQFADPSDASRVFLGVQPAIRSSDSMPQDLARAHTLLERAADVLRAQGLVLVLVREEPTSASDIPSYRITAGTQDPERS
ncbi:hypothetical protein [Nocardiopsis synnemataformans]|uniref:hypothetical protein n=1 Tax=Nocardiopsis synnemataformans TaxID=61305 RepID=UPI003EBAE891